MACLGIAGWHFKSGRGYMGWGVTGVALMVISGLGRMAEGRSNAAIAGGWSPQAWATGAPLLLIRTLLGLESDGTHLIVDPAIPEPLGRIELLDIPGCWGRMDAFGRARAAD